jgi:hypothetical protein
MLATRASDNIVIAACEYRRGQDELVFMVTASSLIRMEG